MIYPLEMIPNGVLSRRNAGSTLTFDIDPVDQKMRAIYGQLANVTTHVDYSLAKQLSFQHDSTTRQNSFRVQWSFHLWWKHSSVVCHSHLDHGNIDGITTGITHLPAGDQTWLAGKSPNWMEVLIGRSSINGPFSSTPCLMTPEGRPFHIPILDHAHAGET